jgi:hypothetical protein
MYAVIMAANAGGAVAGTSTSSLNCVYIHLSGQMWIPSLHIRKSPSILFTRALHPHKEYFLGFQPACVRWGISQNRRFLWGNQFYWMLGFIFIFQVKCESQVYI